eukprot:361539-Chlamydomonas_euryale.AAC.5
MTRQGQAGLPPPTPVPGGLHMTWAGWSGKHACVPCRHLSIVNGAPPAMSWVIVTWSRPALLLSKCTVQHELHRPGPSITDPMGDGHVLDLHVWAHGACAWGPVEVHGPT